MTANEENQTAGMEAKKEKQEVVFRLTAGQANRFASNFDSYFTRVMGRGNYGGSAVGSATKRQAGSSMETFKALPMRGR
jgi:hypothetical protein